MASASAAPESAPRHRGGRHRRTASSRHASWLEHFSPLARGTLDGFLAAYYDPPLRLGSFIETLAAKGKRGHPAITGRERRMGYWLVKSEPYTYSWQQLLKDGRTYWDGVRNYQARNNLQAMKKGDAVLFYHSNKGLAVVGIARVVREAYPDPTTADPRWVAVEVEPVETLKKPVSLSDIKKEKRLQNIALIKQGRLSVTPLTREELEVIVAKGREI